MIPTIGIDLAKNVFQVHGVVNLPPCVVGIEACGSAHHWARKFQELGHMAGLMSPQFVNPNVKSNKNDAADGEAIYEAVTRQNMCSKR